ncbi:MAG: SDR family oxidoreductase [Bdellovibrionales bacterium]|nr:SDR family oxidoreductase [Bdellovibrionales bacterium]
MTKKILITGASRGFGKLAVELLIERGHEVVAALRGGSERGDALFSESILRTGRLHFIDWHAERTETLKAAASWVTAHWNGQLDVLINNAGYGLMGPLEGQTDAQMRRQMEVNFFGPLNLTRECLPFLKRSQGRIINVSSIAGLAGFPFYGAYNASKFALEAISEAFYYELRSSGVQVALVEPGSFRTDFSASTEFGSPGTPENEPKIEAFKKRMDTRRSLLSGDPTRVARLLVRLCEKKKIPLRTAIGRDAALMLLIRKALPDCWRVELTSRVFEKIFFRPS